MARKTITVAQPVYNKLIKMGFAGQSLGELIDDLCDFAKAHIEELYGFLDERYPDEEDEEDEEDE
jgi:predicted CopG family antitoxin